MSSKTRIVSALVLIPLVVLMILYLSTAIVAVVFALVCMAAAREWANFAGWKHALAINGFMVLAGSLMLMTWMLLGSLWPRVLVFSAVGCWAVAAALVIAVQHQRLALPSSPWLKSVAGVLVLVPAWSSLVILHASGREGVVLLLMLLVIVWSADISAYFIGKKWGKTRLCSRISPGKSREGVYAAVLVNLFFGAAYSIMRNMQLIDIITVLLLCVITVLVSVIGDLFESLMKRTVNLKDSGDIIPGHGGILDRIDSLTAAAPVFLAGLWLTGILT